MQPLAHHQKRCTVCDQVFNPGENECRNPLCAPGAQRSFTWNFAIAMRSGVLEQAINRYKFDGVRQWALLFGRILVGFLEEQARTFETFDLIVASPTYVGPDGRVFDHTRLVLERAAEEEPIGAGWPFDLASPPAIVKNVATESFTGKKYADRKSIAMNQLRDALSVPDPTRTAGKSILVYDDVFTDGLTLREVARCLMSDGGAREVCGVTLCRQPFRSRR